MTLPVNQQASTMALHTFHTEFEDGHEANLTALLVDDEPWFRGAEAAATLGYKNTRKAIIDHVDNEDKTTMQNFGSNSALPLTNPNELAAVYISESGLYSLIMRSKLPCAKLFQRWVLKDVLPAIRRTGSYSTTAATRSTSPSSRLTDVQHWQARRALLDTLAASHSLAQIAGIQLGEGHRKAVENAINEVLLPPGQQQIHMIDAAEFLQRRGHSQQEVTRLASEFGRALKTASERLGRTATLNHHDFMSGSGDVQMYHAHNDARLLETVYQHFQRARSRPARLSCPGGGL